jgi:hypothetical protein
MPYLSPSLPRRLAVGPLLWAALALGVGAAERNVWPLWVGEADERTGQFDRAQALGPLLAEQRGPEGRTQQIIRPFFLREQAGQKETGYFLYPLLSWRQDGDFTSYSIFQLINSRTSTDGRGVPQRGFDIWPFYFSRDTGDPSTSYRALLPIAGTIKQRFGKDELSWTLFPLHLHVVEKGKHTQYLPWPILRRIDGAGHRGLEIWPIVGARGRAGDYHEQFFLWPLIYQQERNLSAPVPDVKTGFLPFYTRDTGPGLISENYLWPFFGYTDRKEPTRYHETRYFWPLFVQGRGDDRVVNRWAPFYSHSVVKGYDKTWILFPLGRTAKWQEQGVAHERTQFFWVLYWNHEQRSLANPAAAPAVKQHLWPFYSAWDNGAGRRQFQLFSPFEVFFANNQPIRDLYSPLFAVYRYDERAPDDVRWNLLWHLVSRTRTPTVREFNLGPLFSSRTDGSGRRIALGAGLLSWRRESAQGRWHFSFLDFRPRPAKALATPASP